ncbi:S8 family peptidase [Enterococcus raffinosus]|uniref:S8 family peptidase n=1 Tax=Enterococcus raffinosus TaxID=71452 RepID=UPI001C126F17|nr:S8 family peptidase [Enterococcus raffinosus]MBU5362562.1 S8 family peptidase [Enterococcus raffinosus]
MILKVPNEFDMNKIELRLNDTEKNDITISAIDSIETFLPQVDIHNRQERHKMTFLDFRSSETNSNAKKYILDTLQQKNISFSLEKYGNSEIIIFKESNLDKLKFVRELPIKSIEPLEETLPPFPLLSVDFSVEENFISYEKDRAYPVVGLLDTGVEINDFTKDWVVQGKGGYYTEGELNTDHGTYIASLLIHGDKLNGFHDSSVSGCRIVDVSVVPKFPITGPELVRNIENAITKNPNVNIWNLSVSLDAEIQNDRFSDFAVELDRIQKENQVLIFKSAGNDAAFYSGGIAGKLSIGADSVRSMTVGSANRESDDFGFSVKDYPSPYSRIGRGPASIIKPEVVDYGGDVFALKSNPSSKNEFEVIGEIGFSGDCVEERQVGTSFSTPKVAKKAAELTMLLQEEFDPLLIKALLIHSAGYAESPIIKWEEKLKKLGYGKPKSADIILEEDDYSATLLLRGNLAKGKNINIMDFPFPKNLVKDGKFRGRIKATLVYDPHLISGLGAEYCQSNLNLKLGTFSKKFDREDSHRRFNPIGREDSKNLLNTDLYAKNKMKQNVTYGVERLQIKYGDKYYPVKKYDSDLSELRPANEELLNSDRNWFLFLEGQYRDFVTKYYQAINKVPSIDYCLIISIIDPEEALDVYTDTIRSLDQYNFVHENIISEVDIHIDRGVDL